MRAISYAILLVLTAGLTRYAMAQSSPEPTRYSFTSESQLFIDGTSSLHDWTCDIESSTGGFTTLPGNESTPFSIETGFVSIGVDDIECGKGTMNKKLKKALTINDAETIEFALASASVSTDDGTVLAFNLTGDLTIAGTTRSVDLTATGSSSDDTVLLEGSYSLLQTDFGVDPPTALLGRLKTGDEVTIRFVVTATTN